MSSDPKAGPPGRPQGRSVRLGSRAEEIFRGLRTPFVAPRELEKAGEFYITGYDKRRNRRFDREECVYTVAVVEGEHAGYRLLTLTATPIRERIGRLCREELRRHPDGLGPCALLEGRMNDGNPIWLFCDLDPATGERTPIRDPGEEPEPEAAAAGPQPV